MLRTVLAASLSLLLSLFLMTNANTAQADDSEARSAYEEAQAHKRSNRFETARSSFQRVTEFTGPEDAVWANQAREELRYGLPLQEARVLAHQLMNAGDFPGRRQTLARIDTIYRQLLADNSDRPERVAEIERLRDELAIARQNVSSAERSSVEMSLDQLRRRIHRYYLSHRQWPDWNVLQQELADSLKQAGLKEDRLYISNYYPSEEQFYATLHDTQNGADITLQGDPRGVTLERR